MDNSEMLRLTRLLKVASQDLAVQIDKMVASLEGAPQPPWMFPVGSADAPVSEWYCAQFHTYQPGGRGHTGLDLNLDRRPWGDVDRGMPVRSVAKGIVTSSGSSAGWLGVAVVKSSYQGEDLWIRYAHLQPVSVLAGDAVDAGRILGSIGDYTAGQGGDHLHFDMARSEFPWYSWLDDTVEWVDPEPILRDMLGEDAVNSLLERSNG